MYHYVIYNICVLQGKALPSSYFPFLAFLGSFIFTFQQGLPGVWIQVAARLGPPSRGFFSSPAPPRLTTAAQGTALDAALALAERRARVAVLSAASAGGAQGETELRYPVGGRPGLRRRFEQYENVCPSCDGHVSFFSQSLYLLRDLGED